FIERPNHKKVWPQITAAGRKRLKNMLPFYDKKIIWDGKIYLMTYDIPEIRKKDRELLRHFAKKLGMGMLQESVWITPYNPREVLTDFIKERNLKGAIIVSDIGKDGAVGDEDLKSLLARVYKLEELNERYLGFISDVKAKKLNDPVRQQFTFLSILGCDPQLPWDLLPADWHGYEAYKVYKRTINNSKLNML
ncbi:hypothetical protein HY338_03740, partial [Candidatus Gottesmanbacteria bacterium]|nr:hypothetical protein [Candidatus Gottesmanbacteria bacterium]